MEKNTIKLSFFKMSSKEIIKKVLSNNLTQSESASVMQDIFMGKVADQEIENFNIFIK